MTVKQGFQQAWQGWKKVARHIADFQGRLLLTIIYAVFVGPLWVIRRLAGKDPLGLHAVKRASYWVSRSEDPDLNGSMKQQF